jgi:hypothetical protein
MKKYNERQKIAFIHKITADDTQKIVIYQIISTEFIVTKITNISLESNIFNNNGIIIYYINNYRFYLYFC